MCRIECSWSTCNASGGVSTPPDESHVICGHVAYRTLPREQHATKCTSTLQHESKQPRAQPALTAAPAHRLVVRTKFCECASTHP
eukprot:3460753-Prymnesium_polylepis.1